MNALETALYTKLAAGTALTALLADGTASIFNQVAPRNSTFPYVEFGLQGGGDENMCPARFKNLLYRVKAVSDVSMKTAGEIDDAVDALLHGATLTVNGWHNFWCRRDSDFRYAEFDPEGNAIWHAGGVYRIRLSDP